MGGDFHLSPVADVQAEHATSSAWILLALWAMCSGSECRRKKKTPNPSTASARMTAIVTISVSVSPGGVMNIADARSQPGQLQRQRGQWCAHILSKPVQPIIPIGIDRR